jgi:predicted DNA binding protein
MEAEKQEQIHKDGNDDTYVVYTTRVKGTSDTLGAYCKKNENGTHTYSAYRQDRDGFSVDCGVDQRIDQRIFEELKTQYDAQQSSKKE